jgi:hypothetical protein
MAISPLVLSILVALAVPMLGGCGGKRDTAEEHRKLSLRIEHLPPRRSAAGEEVELSARVQSSLDGPKLEAAVTVLEPEGERRHPLPLAEDGSGALTLPGLDRGEVLRYYIEARDAAGLVVTLPPRASEGNVYELRFEGSSYRLLGGTSHLSAVLATLLFVGAAAAAAQNLRGRMSAGPAGMLGGFGLLLAVVGLFLIGGIHATLVTGRPWPSSPLFLSLTRGDLGIVSLIWAATLLFGRNVLLDETPEGGAPQGERLFSIAALAAGILTIGLALF